MAPQVDMKIAVLIPCCNEELTVGKVVRDFARELPGAEIYVFDNNSTDASRQVARECGAILRQEARQGKGFVVASMFHEIKSDIYVLVDADDTYPAEEIHRLMLPVAAGEADMVVGARVSQRNKGSFRPFHLLGNRLICGAVNLVFGTRLTDIFSGYRVFNAHIVSQIPVVSRGFELETEMTIQCLYYGMKLREMGIPYRERPQGSHSKLSTFRDGGRVVWQLFRLFRSCKPLTFFGGMGLVLFVLGALAGAFPIHDYISRPDHYVEHVPLAILATGLMILSGGCIFLGILLHALNWRFLELHNVMTRRR